MEEHTYYDLRKDGYIRPASANKPEYEQWRETPEMNSWKYRSAIAPRKKIATAEKQYFRTQIKTEYCLSDGCSNPVHKAGFCYVHWLERKREKNRIYSARRRAELKAQGGSKPSRTCNECGKPALEYVTMNLCREHYNAYQRETRRRRNAEIDAIKEAQDATKKSLLERLWSRKLAEYENQDESTKNL